MSDPKPDYHETLLFRWCKTEERYRQVLAQQAAERERARRELTRQVLADSLAERAERLRPFADAAPPRPAAATPQRELPQQLLAKLEFLLQNYPEKMRDLFADVILDLVQPLLKDD